MAKLVGSENKVFVSKIYLPKKENLIKYIDRIYESGWLTNNGPLVQELEKKLEEFLGVRNLLLVCNGTSGLQLASMALGIQGEAITTPFSFAATSSSLVVSNVKPAFVDICPKTYNIDASKIEAAITANTSAIVPVHVFGNPCDIDAIEEIGATHNLKILFDASHAFGSDYGGKSILSYGDASVVSFHATKVFHTIEGGAVVFKDDETYEKAKILRSYGIDGPDSVAYAGINAKMNEFEAAMGLCNLEEYETIIEQRKRSYDFYFEHLGDYVQLQEWNRRGTPSYSYVPVVFTSNEEMNLAREALNAKNIFPRQYFSPSLDTVDYGYGQQPPMSVSRDIASRIMIIPLHSGIEGMVTETIIESVLESRGGLCQKRSSF